MRNHLKEQARVTNEQSRSWAKDDVTVAITHQECHGLCRTLVSARPTEKRISYRHHGCVETFPWLHRASPVSVESSLCWWGVTEQWMRRWKLRRKTCPATLSGSRCLDCSTFYWVRRKAETKKWAEVVEVASLRHLSHALRVFAGNRLRCTWSWRSFSSPALSH